MRTVLDHIPMMVVMADAHGRARFVNREFERVFGWSAAEASRMDLFQAVYPDAVERTHAIEAIRRADASWKEYEPTNRGGARVRSVWACVALPDATIICMGRVSAGTGFERDLLAPTASSLLQLGVPRAELPS